LGDNAHRDFPIYRGKADDDLVKTIATGVYVVVVVEGQGGILPS